MKKIPSFFALIIILFTISCQKELSDQSTENPTIGDTTRQFRIKTIWEYSYEIPGVAADSSRTDFTYDTMARTISIRSVFWDSQFSDPDSSRNTFHYNSNGDWMEEDEYNPGLNTVAWTNRFVRNASGQALQYNYTRNSPAPESYSAFFQYQSLPGGGQRVKVIDTTYLDYAIADYYQVDMDANGLIQKIEFLPWSISEGHVVRYSYSASGQMQQVTDSSINSSGDGYVVLTNYVQELTANGVLETFVKKIKGNNFWWYMQDKYYNFNLFYDNYYVGAPLKEFTVKSQEFQSGVLVNQSEFIYSFQNTIDTNRNLIESLIVLNGNIVGKRKFAYEKLF